MGHGVKKEGETGQNRAGSADVSENQCFKGCLWCREKDESLVTSEKGHVERGQNRVMGNDVA